MLLGSAKTQHNFCHSEEKATQSGGFLRGNPHLPDQKTDCHGPKNGSRNDGLG